MTNRIWIPSPNYSSSRSRTQLLVVHTSEGATTFRNLGNFLSQSSAGVSYQVGFDDTSDTDIGEYVHHNNKAWAAMNANDWGEHGCCCTPSGASGGWSRDTWLSKDRMLRACAGWLAEEAARYNIPLVKINANDILAGRPGVCGHGDCSAAGAGGSHYNPGDQFPWDHVLALAGGALTEEADLTPEEHTFLVQIHESIPMLREDLALSKDIANNVAGTGATNNYQNDLLNAIKSKDEEVATNVSGTGPMNEYQNKLLNDILVGVNLLLEEAGHSPIKEVKPPK